MLASRIEILTRHQMESTKKMGELGRSWPSPAGATGCAWEGIIITQGQTYCIIHMSKFCQNYMYMLPILAIGSFPV